MRNSFIRDKPYIAWISTIRTIIRLTCASVILGCSPDLADPPESDPSTLFWSLTLNHRAAAISYVPPYDTVQLVAIPRNVFGEPLSGIDSVAFTTTDTTISLSSSGLVTARSITYGNGARVLVIVMLNGVRLTDTAWIQVTPAPPSALARVMFLPTLGDSAKFAFGLSINDGLSDSRVTAEGRTASGALMTVPLSYRSSDEHIAAINRTTGVLNPSAMGAVKLYASSYAYGVSRTDSIVIRIGLPLSNAFTFRTRLLADGVTRTGYFDPGRVTIGVGGAIVWKAADSTGIAFTEPETAQGIVFGPQAPQDGNIETFLGGTGWDYTGRARKFIAPGTYTFRSTRYPGATGTVVVQAE